MAVVTSRRAVTATAVPISGRTVGFRPSSRSRVRIAVGTLVAIGAIGVMLLIFSTADKRVPVLQLVHDVPAGQQLTAADVRSIELSADPTLAVVHAADLGAVVGRYARVRMISGSLLAVAMLQRSPLVAPGSAVVAVTVPAGELPAGLRERSRVQLVFPLTSSQSADRPAPAPVAGRIVG
ncbi:MAG: SAF domain-containing protein, partial [Ilumatobacteraceae bacterium]